MKTTFVVTVDDSPKLNYGHPDRLLVTIHETTHYLLGDAVGRKIAEGSPPDVHSIATEVGALFATRYPSGAPFRNLTDQLGNRVLRGGIDNRGCA